jgi:biopolymer transport protein ExbD
MKMKGPEQPHGESGPNMTPLVDVVMVILIFLMLAGSFAGTARYIVSKGKIHTRGGGGPPDPNNPLDTPIDLDVIHAAGGGFLAEGTGIKRTGDPQLLRTELATVKQSYEHTFGKDSPKARGCQVVLHPHRDVHYQDLLRVYQAAIQAEFPQVAFAHSEN